MVAKLRLYRPVGLTDFFTENNFIEFPDHLTRAELAEITTLTSGRARGMFFRQCRKLGAVLQLGESFQAGFFGGNQNMSSGGGGHGTVLLHSN